MNLIGEEFIPTGKKNTNKTQKMILIAIIVLSIIIVVTLIAQILLKGKNSNKDALNISIDGVEQADLDNIIMVNDNKIYMPIRDIAPYLQYDSFNGDYINKSEDTTKCYVETNEEIAQFTANSNVLEKINKNTQEKTYYTFDDPVQMQDGKLYANEDIIQKAFNVYFYKEGNQLNIYTMEFLIESYKNVVIESGFKDISIKFDDEKAILESLLIVKNDGGAYGVFNVDTKETILEAKYNKIEYIPTTNEFLVKTNGKMGIITATGKERIKLNYESIELVNQELNYYVVSNEGKFGIINENEEIIVPIHYDSIGVNINNFPKNNLKNNYVILDKIIPVRKNDLWGLYDINGTLLTKEGYDGLGCTNSRGRNTESLLVISDYNVIVVKQDDLYYLIYINGEKLFNGTGFDSAYISTDDGETNYCVTRNGKTYNAVDLIEEWNKNNN